MTWIRTVAAAFVALLLTVALGANLALAQSGGGAVTISDFQFTPATLQVAQGTTVTWTNNGPTNHTATSDTGAWDSGVLPAGKSFSFKFDSPGTFAYHCSIHPNMKGTITVTAAAASPAPSAAATQAPAAATSPSPSPAASTRATQASPSPSASKAAAPAQLPKTGAGGLGTPASKAPWALLGLLPVLGAGVWGVRRARGSRRF